MSARHAAGRLCTTYAVAAALREQSDALLAEPSRLIDPVSVRDIRGDLHVVPTPAIAAPYVLRHIARAAETPWTPRPKDADRTPAQLAADAHARGLGVYLDELAEARLA